MDQGRAGDAVRLANNALFQFGDTAAADRIVKLVRQANALLSAQIAGQPERFARFKSEYDAAATKKTPNLRAATLALEEALLNGDDANLKQKLDDIRAQLARYDDLRATAAQMRRAPSNLEEALAKLDEAAKLWDTGAVRLEIDDLRRTLAQRRNRLALAAFEVHGDVGVPGAGVFVADELWRALQARFELVERAQVDKIVAEFKIDRLADDDLALRKVGQAAGARLLVVGSITPVAGLTVHARLVDVQTGLIVQTGNIVVARLEDLGQRLPQLAEQLLMNDDEKRGFEARADNESAVLAKLEAEALPALPPPPPVLAEALPPPPLIPARLPPPEQPANLRPQHFQRLPMTPSSGFVWPAFEAQREWDFRRRCAFLALELGDNMFRRNQFREALKQFTFCLTLFPENAHVRARIERCTPRLPPEPPGKIRPRLAILDFLTFGEPRLLSPDLGPWSAQNIAGYFCPDYELADRTELLWWMGRLGLNCADLVTDSLARHYLARAMNLRSFLFGTVELTGSFDAAIYLVDAHFGFLANTARIHVQNIQELKLRLSELAWLTRLAPDERLGIERAAAAWNLLVADIRLCMQRAVSDRTESDFKAVIEMCGKALKQRPNHVQMLDTLRNAENQLRLQAVDEIIRNEQAQRAELVNDWRQQQTRLAHDAGEARRQAEQDATENQQPLLAQRRAAAAELVSQAQQAYRENRFASACQLLESAVALRSDEDTFREWARARVKQEESANVHAAQVAAAQGAAIRREQDTVRALARAQLEEERRLRAAAEQARRQSAEERDRRAVQHLLELAQQYAGERQFERAVAAAALAKQLRPTPEIEQLANDLLIDLARANAEKRGAAAKVDLEQRLAVERDTRHKAEAEAQRNRKRFEELLAQGAAALHKRQFDAAIEHFSAAQKIYQTDVVLVNLQKAQSAKAQADAVTAAEQQKADRQRQQAEEAQHRLADAGTAFDAGQLEQAVQLYRAAAAIAPAKAKVEVLAGLAKAEQARDQEQSAARRSRERQEQKESCQKMLAGAKVNMIAKQTVVAVMTLRAALKLDPNDAQALAAQTEAWDQLSDFDKEDVEKNLEAYGRLMAKGRRELAARQYHHAIQSFNEANRLARVDKGAATLFVEEAQRAKSEADQAMRQEVQTRQAEAKKAAELSAALTMVRAALVAGQLDAAAKAAKAAALLDANHPLVVQAQAELRKAQDIAKPPTGAKTGN